MARVLVIDDDEILAEMVTELLEENEHMVSAVHHGSDALAAAMTALPDLLILDYTLPGRSGLEVLEQLRAVPELENVPVIMLTASTDASLVVKAAIGGADDYVMKPFNPSDLLRRTEVMLKGSKLARQLSA